MILLMLGSVGVAQNTNSLINKSIEANISTANERYIDLHQNPELSLMEVKTAAKMAKALKELGFEVTEKVGGHGVVGVLKNGDGPTIMLRTDMDALPVLEKTGLEFASKAVVPSSTGERFPAMHACGHDFHMTVWLGTLQTLVDLKDKWNGTILAIAQPAEEKARGAKDMIAEGLFSTFPKPDYAFAYHVSADLPAGKIGYFPGPIFAGVCSVEIDVQGRGGHGAMPHTTIDPIVLASRIVLDLQTIVSREINPFNPAVVTVGSIHGGTKHNIIPDEVKMQLTVRFFTEDVFEQIEDGIKRIASGVGQSAGLSGEMLPKVTFLYADKHPPVTNSESLVNKSVEFMESILKDEQVIKVDPATVGEDFGLYGLTPENIPIALFWLGGQSNETYKEFLENGTTMPALHNSAFHPDFIPAYKTGVAAMSKNIILHLNK